MSNGCLCSRRIRLKTQLGSKHKWKTAICGQQERLHEGIGTEAEYTKEVNRKLAACDKKGGYLRSKDELKLLLENPKLAPKNMDQESFLKECAAHGLKIPEEVEID